MKFARVIILALGLAVTANAQRISELPETNYLADVDSLYWLSKEDTGYASRRVLWGLLRSNVNTGLSLTNMAETVEGRTAQILRYYGFERLTLLSLDQFDQSGAGIWFSDSGVPYWQIRTETDATPMTFLDSKSNEVFSISQSNTVYLASGSLGIGTNAPQSRLHIADLTANSSPGIRIRNDAQEWTMKVNGSNLDEWQLVNVTGAKTPIKVFGNADDGMIQLTNGSVVITAGDANAAGLKLIPLSGGTFYALYNTANVFKGMFACAATPGIFWDKSLTDQIIFRGQSGLGFCTAFDSSGMVLNTQGNVGIGTTNPLSRLHVAGDVAIAGTFIASGTTGNTNTANVAGSVNFAALAQTLYVTNAHATNGVLAFATLNTADATATSCAAIPANPAAGVLALRLNAAATAETRVSFLIIKP